MVDPSTEKISWRSRRPRSHQIEDISGRRFEDLLPEAWVSRRITPDYGVDREVEIFTSDGVATGLKFAVQLKATDRSSHADRVVLKTALLTYLLDYDVPAIVVRYDVTTGCTRWAWASAIQDCAQLAPNQKTFTHRFENADIWGVDTPAKVERSLRTRRALATFAPSSPMPVRLHIDDALAEARYAIERAMRELIATSYESLVPADADLAPVELNIRIRPGFLSVDFEALGRMTFDLDTSDVPRMVTAILYALAWLFPRKRLGRHGRDIGRAILAGHYAADHPELAARASYAFADDGMAQAELAILNGLHRGDTPYYFAVVASLIRAGVRERSRDAIQLFLAAALEATDGDASRAAAVHYSTANALREKQPVLALFHYNRARHLRPSYLEADYFLAEVAGALFGLRRFAIAAEAYSRAVAIAPTPLLQLCLGDALLHAGSFQDASDRFELAMESDVAPLVEEAVVKFELCRSLMETHGNHMAANWTRPMGDLPVDADGPTVWAQHLATINALDPLANFNLGVSDAARGDDASALGRFVACAVVQTHDVEAWTNAIISALRTGQAEAASALIHLSIRLAGLSAYDDLRNKLLSRTSDPAFIAQMDAIALAADQRPDPTRSNQVTLRILDDDRAHVISSGADDVS